ncbi:MAG: TIR domain-containing protein [Acidobacteriota bacterium]
MRESIEPPSTLADDSRVLEILRRSLAKGHTLEIDGLGTLRSTSGGGYEFLPHSRPRVFIAYVVEDLKLARKLRDGLAAAGCAPWLDKDQLLAGQDWPRAIERAIGTADAFIACFSPRSLKKRGQFQCELRLALEQARRRPLWDREDDAFLLPVRLEPCEVPRRIAEHVQYVDLFPDWDSGLQQLIRSIRKLG